MCVCTRNTSQMSGTWCEGIIYCNTRVDKKCKHIASTAPMSGLCWERKKYKNMSVLFAFNTTQMNEEYY